jgi:hypothetical protein
LWWFGIFLLKKSRYEKKKSHNMLYLMLNPIFRRFEKLCLVYSFIGFEKGVNIVEEYDRQSLYPMLLKCYHYLHPLA